MARLSVRFRWLSAAEARSLFTSSRGPDGVLSRRVVTALSSGSAALLVAERRRGRRSLPLATLLATREGASIAFHVPLSGPLLGLSGRRLLRRIVQRMAELWIGRLGRLKERPASGGRRFELLPGRGIALRIDAPGR